MISNLSSTPPDGITTTNTTSFQDNAFMPCTTLLNPSQHTLSSPFTYNYDFKPTSFNLEAFLFNLSPFQLSSTSHTDPIMHSINPAYAHDLDSSSYSNVTTPSDLHAPDLVERNHHSLSTHYQPDVCPNPMDWEKSNLEHHTSLSQSQSQALVPELSNWTSESSLLSELASLLPPPPPPPPSCDSFVVGSGGDGTPFDPVPNGSLPPFLPLQSEYAFVFWLDRRVHINSLSSPSWRFDSEGGGWQKGNPHYIHTYIHTYYIYIRTP